MSLSCSLYSVLALSDEWWDHSDESQDESDLRTCWPGASLSGYCQQVSNTDSSCTSNCQKKKSPHLETFRRSFIERNYPSEGVVWSTWNLSSWAGLLSEILTWTPSLKAWAQNIENWWDYKYACLNWLIDGSMASMFSKMPYSMMCVISALYFVPQIVDLFNWLVQPCLDFIDGECRFVVQTSPIHLAHSLMKLYTCLMG